MKDITQNEVCRKLKNNRFKKRYAAYSNRYPPYKKTKMQEMKHEKGNKTRHTKQEPESATAKKQPLTLQAHAFCHHTDKRQNWK